MKSVRKGSLDIALGDAILIGMVVLLVVTSVLGLFFWSKNSKLQKQNNRLQSELSATQQQLESVRQNISALKQENQELNAEIADLYDRNENLAYIRARNNTTG